MDEAMGQQKRPTTTLQKFTSCSLNLHFLCPAVVYLVQLFKMAAEGHAEQKICRFVPCKYKIVAS